MTRAKHTIRTDSTFPFTDVPGNNTKYSVNSIPGSIAVNSFSGSSNLTGVPKSILRFELPLMSLISCVIIVDIAVILFPFLIELPTDFDAELPVSLR